MIANVKICWQCGQGYSSTADDTRWCCPACLSGEPPRPASRSSYVQRQEKSDEADLGSAHTPVAQGDFGVRRADEGVAPVKEQDFRLVVVLLVVTVALLAIVLFTLGVTLQSHG
jgi:hypothetical protein